jgi:hypothetical protein
MALPISVQAQCFTSKFVLTGKKGPDIKTLRHCHMKEGDPVLRLLLCFCVPRGKKTKDLALALGTPYLHVNRA